MVNQKTGVLFVCLVNICRSPMAEAVFRHLVREEGVEEQFHIDSAGTGDWHIGNRPHHGTLGILDEHKISHEGIRARQVAHGDFSQFQYIVAMDDSNVTNLVQWAVGGDAKVIKLLDLIPEEKIKDVPDPYYTGNFEEVYDLITRGCRALLDYIQGRDK
jgi:protein-tyrosine phosphatase